MEASGSFSASLSKDHLIMSLLEAGASSSQLLVLFLGSLEIEVLTLNFSLILGLFCDKLILNILQSSLRYVVLSLILHLLINSKDHLLRATLDGITFMEFHLNIFLMYFQPFIIFIQFVEFLQIVT